MKLKTIKIKVKSERGFKIVNESDYKKSFTEDLKTSFENGGINIDKLNAEQLKEFSKIYEFDYKNVKDSKETMREILDSLSLDM